MDNYKDIKALNYSGAKQILKSPAHFQASLLEERKDSAALKFGRLVHLALLLPREFVRVVKIKPDLDGRTTEGKAAKKAFEESLVEGDEIVDQEMYDVINDITESAEIAVASLGIDSSTWITETPYSMEYNGVAIKGRPDLITTINGEQVVIDLKTCMDASPAEFARTVHNFKYHMQAAWYLKLTGAKKFIFVAVEKEYPYAFRVYQLDEASISEGQKLMDEAVLIYNNSTKFNSWPSYTKDLTELSLPRYAFTSTNQ